MNNTKTITLAVSGDAGSFSEEAGLVYAGREGFAPSMIYAIDMEGVLTAVEQGEAQLGIFPVVNSRGGLVQTAFEAMGHHLFTLVDEIWIEVQQCLLVKPGTTRDQIKRIASHPQAFSQCERYLKQAFEGVPLKDWDDTAKAARDLGAGILDAQTAVIAPARSAQLYGLEVLEKGIQDQHPNLTTFIVVKKL
ncbi:chorismate mutase [Candidatus Uhrbacteria bacterium]|nr:chorismate mutase [Candidatus Uhrbacteria bacterium]